MEKTEDWAIQNNESNEISPPNPKRKKSALLVLFRDEYESNQSLETGSSLPTSADNIVRAEVLKYKSEPSIPLGEQSEYSLDWWKRNNHSYPNLTIMARKYLCITVPSEQLFSTAGNIVSDKRSALLPENVEKLLFLHSNLPKRHLEYEHVTGE